MLQGGRDVEMSQAGPKLKIPFQYFPSVFEEKLSQKGRPLVLNPGSPKC